MSEVKQGFLGLDLGDQYGDTAIHAQEVGSSAAIYDSGLENKRGQFVADLTTKLQAPEPSQPHWEKVARQLIKRLHEEHEVAITEDWVLAVSSGEHDKMLPRKEPIQPSVELDSLAHGMAFDRATETIDAAGIYAQDRWTDISPESLEPYEREGVEESVRYLEMRGLLERHPDHPHWVQVRDESEATA